MASEDTEQDDNKDGIEFNIEFNSETTEAFTEVQEKLEAKDISGGEVLVFVILLFVIGGVFFTFLGMIFDIIFLVFEAIWFCIKWISKGFMWCIDNLIALVLDWRDYNKRLQRSDTTTRDVYDSPGVVGTSKCETDKRRKKKKRSGFFDVSDDGDIFDGVDDFSDFD